MTEISVSLSDYVVATECAIIVWLLASLRAVRSSIRNWFIVFYASIGLAGVTGGTVHGFFAGESSVPHRILWVSTLIALGITSLAGIRIATILQFSGNSARFVERITYVLFACYCFVVLFGNDGFLVAILGYLPMAFFFGFEWFAEYYRQKRPLMLLGGIGAVLTLLAAALQRVPPAAIGDWFNNNVAYHSLQATALLIIYFPARELSKSYERKIHNY